MAVDYTQLAIDTEHFQLYAEGTRHFFDEWEEFTRVATLHGHPEVITKQHIQLMRNVLMNHRDKWTTYRDKLLEISERMARLQPLAIAAVKAPPIEPSEPDVFRIKTSPSLAPRNEPGVDTGLNLLIGAAILAGGVMLGAWLKT